MSVSLSPIGGAASQFFNGNGVPLTGGKIYTYEAGTTTPKATFTAATGLTAHSNPIILDAAGRVPGGEIWLTSAQAYKFVLKTSSGTLVGTWDNIYGYAAGAETAVTEVQVATAGQTDFVLTSMIYTPGSNTLGVFIDGVNQVVNNSYTEVNATLVTFVSGLHVGAVVKFIQINSAATDANLVTYTPAGAGAVPTTVQVKLRENVSVLDFGAVSGGPAADNFTAFQAALTAASAIGGSVYVPTGTYEINDTLVMNTGSQYKGLILYGDGQSSVIQQVGVGKDAIKFSTTAHMQHSGIRNLSIKCDSTAGHCINIVYGAVCSFFDNLYMTQDNENKAIIYGDYSTFGDGVYDCRFSGGEWALVSGGGALEAAVRFITAGTTVNENLFENLRCYNAGLLQFFHVTSVTNGAFWLTNNTWKNINFEICTGGGFLFSSAKGYTLQNISFWDQAIYTNHLVDFVAGTGYESASNTLINVQRQGDSVGMVNDIRIVDGQDTVLINCYNQASAKYDFGNKRCVAIGTLNGTIDNRGGLVLLGNQGGAIQLPNLSGAFLNYFDETTWPAVLIGSTAPPAVPVTATGTYTRVGNRVFVTVRFVNVNLTGATGVLRITGLPFVAVTAGVGTCGLSGLGTLPAIAVIPSGSAEIQLLDIKEIATGIAVVAAAGKYVYVSVSYTV